MPGRASESRPLRIAGLLTFVIGLVGYAIFGWRFGGDADPVSTVLGVVFAAAAIAWTVWNR